VTEAFEEAKPNFASGNFGKGLQTNTLEPFDIGDMSAQTGLLFIEVFGMKIRGISNFHIDELIIDPFNFKVCLESFAIVLLFKFSFS